EDASDAARHAGSEITAGRAEYDAAAACHVLTAVIADRLHHRMHAAVAHAETLACHAANIGFAAGRSVEGDVADDHIILGHKRCRGGRVNDDLAARQALA